MSFKNYVEDAEDKIGRYTAPRDGVDLQEAARRSLARLFGRLQDGTHSHVVITAFRGERPSPESRAADAWLADDLKRLGWG